MNIVHYRPFSLLNELQGEMQNLFNNQPIGKDELLGKSAVSDWAPAVDIKETKESYIVLADIPGVDPKDIKIEMKDKILTISGNKKLSTTEESDSFKRVERFQGSFYRSFNIPDAIDGDSVKAKSKHGVLEIIIPKQKQQLSKQITVQVD